MVAIHRFYDGETPRVPNLKTKECTKEPTQSSLDPWMRSTREGVATPDGDVLAPLLSVTGEVDAVTIGSQEASSVHITDSLRNPEPLTRLTDIIYTIPGR